MKGSKKKIKMEGFHRRFIRLWTKKKELVVSCSYKELNRALFFQSYSFRCCLLPRLRQCGSGSLGETNDSAVIIDAEFRFFFQLYCPFFCCWKFNSASGSAFLFAVLSISHLSIWNVDEKTRRIWKRERSCLKRVDREKTITTPSQKSEIRSKIVESIFSKLISLGSKVTRHVPPPFSFIRKGQRTEKKFDR